MLVVKYVCDTCGASAEVGAEDRDFRLNMRTPETSPYPDKWGVMTITTNPGWTHRCSRVYYFCPSCREKLGLAPHQHIDGEDMQSIVDAIFKTFVKQGE